MTWIKIKALFSNRNKIIRNTFIIPIISVMIISIAHVVSWYDLANPLSWAIYLSVAVEIAAMAAIAAATVRMKGSTVWFVFGIVTFIQFIGNIFFSYKDIDPANPSFLAWIEMTEPVFEAIGTHADDIIAHKRWLALLEGAFLPLISLTCLHFFMKFNDNLIMEEDENSEIKESDCLPLEEESKSDTPIISEESDTTEHSDYLAEEAPLTPTTEELDELLNEVNKEKVGNERVPKREYPNRQTRKSSKSDNSLDKLDEFDNSDGLTGPRIERNKLTKNNNE